MDCARVQDYILTDYLDGCMRGEAKEELEAHLLQCPRCREFASQARQEVIEPFEQIEREQTPETVWANIKESLEEREALPDVFHSFRPWPDILKKLVIPRPAWVLASLLFLVIMTFVVRQHSLNQTYVETQSKEHVEYLAFMIGYPDSLNGEDQGGYGTYIEEIFL